MEGKKDLGVRGGREAGREVARWASGRVLPAGGSAKAWLCEAARQCFRVFLVT